MPLGERNVRRLTGASLVIATIATRLPFATKMLFEFDSVNFAVATFRFSIAQVTPHFPGYILHILFAKFLLLFITDVNQAFVWISILLSVGSVLYLWRAGAALRGERVGFIAALIWLFLPIFWFYGLVATAYEYEAFFASALLYHGMRLLRTPHNRTHLITLFVILSLSTAARQSSLLFFTPAIIVLCMLTKQHLKDITIGSISFALITAVWLGILFAMCGGASAYWQAMLGEHIYRSQSVLFGNPLNEHLAVIAKVILYLIAATSPFVLITLFCFLCYRDRLFLLIRESRKKISFYFIILVAAVPLLFYLAIYFMKAGYLLNVLPSLTLVTAILIDQLAIWHTFDVKKNPGNELILTRPIITKRTAIITVCVVMFNIVWFILPFPGTSETDFNNGFTRDSFNEPRGSTVHSQNGFAYFVNRIFSFTSVRCASTTDRLHEQVFRILQIEQSKNNNLVLIDTWWHRWGFYYLPDAVIYDIRDQSSQDTISVGLSRQYSRTMSLPASIVIPNNAEILLLLRKDHPSFNEISKQVHLEKIDLPEYLDMWRIADTSFTLKWKNRIFVK
ncbi:MAG TPA: hypothetical protein VEW28_00620 [Candidatus Kapabacteria bacterium]|nr:hypothetical protein [Candidatus Kapabacteria bacterium]